MKAKEMAIKRCAIFLADRIDYAMQVRDKQAARVRREDIESLLRQEFYRLPEGEEVHG